MSDSAARHRARQTIINLVLELGASVGLVITLVLIVPRDDSNRIKSVDYLTISKAAKAEGKFNVFTITPPKTWWANTASFETNNVDTIPVFKAGFVGSEVKYIGYTQAFNTNPTWLALSLNGKVITDTYKTSNFTWDIYKSTIVNDPPKTMDYVMVLNYSKQDYVLLYGVGDKKDFDYFANQIAKRLLEGTSIE